jgi:hypothetical protein
MASPSQFGAVNDLASSPCLFALSPTLRDTVMHGVDAMLQLRTRACLIEPLDHCEIARDEGVGV